MNQVKVYTAHGIYANDSFDLASVEVIKLSDHMDKTIEHHKEVLQLKELIEHANMKVDWLIRDNLKNVHERDQQIEDLKQENAQHHKNLTAAAAQNKFHVKRIVELEHSNSALTKDHEEERHRANEYGDCIVELQDELKLSQASHIQTANKLFELRDETIALRKEIKKLRDGIYSAGLRPPDGGTVTLELVLEDLQRLLDETKDS